MASRDSCLIGFGTKRDLKCELIVDWQRARCPRPTLMVSHDTITVGGLRGRKVGGEGQRADWTCEMMPITHRCL